MSGELIPPHDHVTRYVGPSKFAAGVLEWTALLPRKEDAGEGSFNWLEFEGPGDHFELVKAICRHHPLKRSKKGAFVVINVGRAVSRMQEGHPKHPELSFRHTPIEENVSHCSMLGVWHDDTIAGDILNSCETGRFFRALMRPHDKESSRLGPAGGESDSREVPGNSS